MKNIIKKIAQAREEIKATKMEKKGENTFSKYKYFTPEQVEKLVSDACSNNGMMAVFSLIRNEFGVFGRLRLIDIETSEELVTEMATAIPEIKATNIAQQLGGCVTYTERYMKMSAFGITDNSLDFDTTENTKKQNETETKKLPELKIGTENFTKCVKAYKEGYTIEDMRKKYTISEQVETCIKNAE